MFSLMDHDDVRDKASVAQFVARLAYQSGNLYGSDMTDDPNQAARDEWQSALYEAAHRFSVSLKELHSTNPWPEIAAMDQAINMLATELWDRCFSVTEIATALRKAADDLPRYAAGDEVRP